MATKSIFKAVNIKTKKSCSVLVHALESAENFKGKTVDLSKKYMVASKDDIIKLFGEPIK